MTTKSETISELAKSLVKFNAKVQRISKDANNPFFKNDYTTIGHMLNEVKPLLAEFGLVVIQNPSSDTQKVQVKTLLVHESGEWIESDSLEMKPVKNDPQGSGSAITYARRYSLEAFLSLSTGNDDDGNGASQLSQIGKPLGAASAKELNELKTLALQFGELRGKSIEDVYTVLKISDLSKLNTLDVKKHIATVKGWISQAKQ